MGQLISQTVAGLYNGISQQLTGVRHATQSEDEYNTYPSIAEGLTKRPPVLFVKELPLEAPDAKPFSHIIRPDAESHATMILTGDANSPCTVVLEGGELATVLYGNYDMATGQFTEDASVKTYLTSGDPRSTFKALTLADFTIIINRRIATSMTSAIFDGVLEKTVQAYEDLPSTTDDEPPQKDRVYKVQGSANDSFEGYYVLYTGEVYEECPEPQIHTTLDVKTMPHALIRLSPTSFVFSRLVWEDRLVGDDDTCPPASFIGYPLDDVFMFKNRLGFLSGEYVCLSRADDLFNFWSKTALDVLDDDPIDTAVSSEQVALLSHAIAFNESLMLFGASQQFALNSSDTTLTPSSVSADVTTRFPADVNCPPVGAGANVYFACPQKKHLAIREYFVQPESLVNDAVNITAHVPRYLPSTAHSLVTVPTLDTLFLASDEAPNTLFVYKFYWSGNEKVQSAWGKWLFDAEILTVGVDLTNLEIIFRKGQKLYLTVIELEESYTENLPYRIHLDFLQKVSGEVRDGRTHYKLPLAFSNDSEVVLVNPSDGLPVSDVRRDTATSMSVYGEFPNEEYYVGQTYPMFYRFTPWTLKDQQVNVDKLTGRLQVRNLTLGFKDTGDFEVRSTPEGRDTLTTTMSNVVVGASTLGEIPIKSSIARFPIYGNARTTWVDIYSKSHLPCNVQNASWEGFYHARATGI